MRAKCEAAAAARVQAREAAAKKAKKGAKKPKKGAAPPPPEEEESDPPSALEIYDGIKSMVEEHTKMRQEERAREREKAKLVPRDPDGEMVMEEVCSIVGSVFCRVGVVFMVVDRQCKYVECSAYVACGSILW